MSVAPESRMDDHDEIEHLRLEVRRLKQQIIFLEEEKDDLHRRYVFICQELERTRAKVPKGISTS